MLRKYKFISEGKVMLKKILTLTAAFAVSFGVFCSVSNDTKVRAYDYDTVEIDMDGDGYDDWELTVLRTDETDKECSLVAAMPFSDEEESFTIPQTVSIYRERVINGEWIEGYVDYTVTAVESFYETNFNYCSEIDIPYTVTQIDPETLGYTQTFYYNPDTNQFSKTSEINLDVKFKCVSGTAGEEYATENGFSTEIYPNIADAQGSIANSFTYSGGEYRPVPNVTYGGETLVYGQDFTVSYENNVNAGTATAVVNGINKYRGQLDIPFKILPKQAAQLSVTSIADQNYTGYAVVPSVTVRDNGKLLIRNKDYTVSCTNNVNIGKAQMIISFKGNYAGTKSISYNIVVPKITNLKASGTSVRSVKLTWNAVKCSEYKIYRYVKSRNKYVCIATTTTNSYKNMGLSQATAYQFKVRAVVNGQSGATTAVQGVTKVQTPDLQLAALDKSVKVMWDKNTKATGFQIYRMTADDDYYWWWGIDVSQMKNIKTVRDSKATSFTNLNLSNSKTYYYIVRAYVKIDGKNYYSDYSEAVSSASAGARLNGATLKSHTSYKVYNRQGSTQSSYTITLSKSDINTLKKFASTHFKSGMTRGEKVQTTLDWINKNVKYAKASSDWNQIANKSWVDAIFNYKKGQCAQYNGALIGMMAYLGYDVNMVQGYRGQANGNHWQHFWGEVKICGQTYVMEAGNYGEDGSWSFNCAKYSEAGGYIMFNKNY